MHPLEDSACIKSYGVKSVSPLPNPPTPTAPCSPQDPVYIFPDKAYASINILSVFFLFVFPQLRTHCMLGPAPAPPLPFPPGRVLNLGSLYIST